MDITWRDLMTVFHGMGFGALFVFAFSGGILELYRLSAPDSTTVPNHRESAWLRFYLTGMAVLAWCAVFSGAYIIYPWYRAVAPAGIGDFSAFPQKLLLSSPATSDWHNLGMEWKEHVAWIAPISVTMVAYVYAKYGPNLKQYKLLRQAALIFMLAAFVAAGTAAFFGAFLNKYAPVRGGETIHLMKGVNDGKI